MSPEDLAGILEQCLARGFALPLHLVALGANGCLVAVRYELGDEGGLEAHELASHDEQPGFVLPINVMIIDSTGERAARVVLEPSGEQRWLN